MNSWPHLLQKRAVGEFGVLQRRQERVFTGGDSPGGCSGCTSGSSNWVISLIGLPQATQKCVPSRFMRPQLGQMFTYTLASCATTTGPCVASIGGRKAGCKLAGPSSTALRILTAELHTEHEFDPYLSLLLPHVCHQIETIESVRSIL